MDATGSGGGEGDNAEKYNFKNESVKAETAFLLIIFENRKRWNRRIVVNGMQHFLGIGRTERVFHLFRLFHLREWNSWKSSKSWNSGDRFRWTLNFYSGIE